jgi:hypothetical protein
MEKRETPETSTLEKLRPAFNMEDENDAKSWDTLCKISTTSVDSLMTDFVTDMLDELKRLEEQILTVEKQRLSSLNNKVLRKQCREILDELRKERDGLRQTLGSETYKRVAAGISRRTL